MVSDLSAIMYEPDVSRWSREPSCMSQQVCSWYRCIREPSRWSGTYQPPSMSREVSVWIVSREVWIIANYITLGMVSRP